ncbi:hypothetical protein MBRA1_003344 [Malassezia brasiliensis]|uniref:Exonuclease 1 n=1 Tax=Malassezia brasiliensis TaxID=1821822 RepID=A0AAF0DVS4_9BASI|nr:hypothetical protein MBRA1_003344 [Malassezia brasiliensis]
MGIAGLLPLLKDIQEATHVEKYRGKTVGIDAYVWLHRGAYACASDLALGRPTTRYIAYAMHRIRMLRHYGVIPYVVFDGGPLPSKAHTEAERAAKRAEHRAKGLALHQQNKGSAARDAFVRCVDVTPAMAHELIRVLRAEGIAYVVAPYEADAQLAYMERQGLIDAIITEDSDLLVFGCKTVLFKLDTYGHCVEVQQARFASTQQISLEGWGADEFRRMAILSGCDYLPSIVGMGLKNAHRFLRRYESVDNVLRALRLEGKLRVPPGYADDFRRAEFTFVHQRVWDPRGSGCMTTLSQLPDDVDDALLTFIGAPIPWEVARQIAAGDLCPIDKSPLGRPAPLQRAASAPQRGAQASLHAFFGKPADAAPTQHATPAPRRVLGELDVNCTTLDPRAQRTRTPRAASWHTPPGHAPPHTPTPSAAGSVAPTSTPQSSRFFTPHTHAAPDAESHSSDVGTPQTSPRTDASLGAGVSPHRKDAWNDGVSSPVSSPGASPTRATPARAPSPHASGGASDSDGDDDADAARRAAWFARFQFNAPRPDATTRAARTPCRTHSDVTPTRRPAAAPWSTPRLPLAQHTPRVLPPLKRAHASPPRTAPRWGGGKRRAVSARALSTPTPAVHAPSARDAPAARAPCDTPVPLAGSAKLLQFRYKET